MDNLQKTLLFSFAGLLMVILIIWFLMRKPKKQDTPQVFVLPNNMPGTPDNSAQVQSLQEQIKALQAQAQAQEQKGNDNFPLQPGSIGTKVKQLQMFLIKKYGAMITASGKFDFQTAFAVKKNLSVETVSEATFRAYNLQDIPM